MFPSIEIMEDDTDDTMFDAYVDLNDVVIETDSLFMLNDTIDNLHALHSSVENFGVTKSLMSFCDNDRVLSSVIPAFAACEALDGDAGPDTQESEAVKKGLLEKIKDATASWFKKAWDVAANWGTKLGNFIKAAYNKVASAAEWTKDKVFDAAKAAKEMITAHPVASIFAAITAALAVAALVAHFTTVAPMSEEQYNSVQQFFSKNSKNFGGKLPDSSYAEWREKNKTTALAAGLGYTKENFEKLTTAAKDLFKDGGPLTKIADFFKNGIPKMLSDLKNKSSSEQFWGRKAINFIIKNFVHLWRNAPATTITLILTSLGIFKKLFK